MWPIKWSWLFLRIRQNRFPSLPIRIIYGGGWKQNSGLDLNYLKFSNKGFIYVIYDEYDAETASRSIGIKVLNPKTKKEVDMKGDPKTLKGTMLHFRDYDEIIKGEVDPER